MPKKAKALVMGLFLAIIGVVCVAMVAGKAHAEEVNYEQSGEGWSINVNGVMLIESNQGWANCLKDGFVDNVRKLIIGKDVASFRMYSLPEDLPSEDFFGPEDIITYSVSGNPIYDFKEIRSLFPSMIGVEDGNSVFRVVDGLLINTVTNELVLSETGVSDVEIPEGVRTITKGAFYRRPLKSVQFPTSLESIGEYAFAKCEYLTKIDLPDSLTQLSEGAFFVCSNLEHVTLSQNLSVIGKYVFYSCLIQQIEIPENVNEIGGWAFFGCKNLENVLLHDGLKIIGWSAFSDCKQLQSINLPEGLTSIGEAAFDGCYSLKRVILPDSLELIGHKSFWGCKIAVLRISAKLTFLIYDEYHREFIVNPHTMRDKSFKLSSVNTVILSGSDYDFGYPAITDANNVYFLGLPPEDVGRILDEDSVEKIYCSDEFEFEWTRSTVASWVRQRLTILPADEINEWAETTINTTPKPTSTPRPTRTPRSTPTPWPTPMPRPSVSPVATVEPEEQAVDPILFVFAGVIALVVAGIVVMAVKNRKPKNRTNQKNK
jgi:hypothetical protein